MDYPSEKFSRPLRDARFPAEHAGIKAAGGWGRACGGRMATGKAASLRRCSAFGNAWFLGDDGSRRMAAMNRQM